MADSRISFLWDISAVEQLKMLWTTRTHGRHLLTSEIAAMMGGGLSRNAIIGKASRLGLPARDNGKGHHPHPYSPNANRKRWKAAKPFRPARIAKETTTKPTAPLKPTAALQPPLALTITEFTDDPREPRQCRFALSQKRNGEYLFCGNSTWINEQTGERASWCEAHRRIAVIVGSNTKPRVTGKHLYGG